MPISRETIIKEYIKNKNVLDIGCVSDQEKNHYKFAGLHKYLIKHAKDVEGLDINKKGVEFLRNEGFVIFYGNAENFNLKKKYDIIVAAELIEHLSNQGLFLESVYKHLEEKGKLIITTPNAFGMRFFIRNLLGALSVNKGHTLWHDENTLKQILNRFNFRVERIENTFDDSNTIKSKIERLICVRKKVRPQLVMVCSKR